MSLKFGTDIKKIYIFLSAISVEILRVNKVTKKIVFNLSFSVAVRSFEKLQRNPDRRVVLVKYLDRQCLYVSINYTTTILAPEPT